MQRYAIRDPSTGKFVRLDKINWQEVHVMNTIDNETQEDITEQVRDHIEQQASELPTLGNDPVQIRTWASKLADGMIAATNFGRIMDELKTKNAQLEADIAAAKENEAIAIAAHLASEQAAKEAKADAQMAREAYGLVAAERVNLNEKLAMYSIEIDELKDIVNEEKCKSDTVAEQLNHTMGLLEVAQEERYRFRTETEELKQQIDDDGRHYSNLLFARDDRINSLKRENDGFLYKINGLEDEHQRVVKVLSDHKDVLKNLRKLLGMEDDPTPNPAPVETNGEIADLLSI